MAVSWTVGPLIGGPLVTRLKMSMPRTLAATFIAHSVMTAGYLTAMLLPCPEADWAGNFTDQGLAAAALYDIAPARLRYSFKGPWPRSNSLAQFL